MKYVYVSNAVPERVCNHKKSSVAGNKFSINMARALNKMSGDSVEFISLSQVEKAIEQKKYEQFLLFGVTGSRKN